MEGLVRRAVFDPTVGRQTWDAVRRSTQWDRTADKYYMKCERTARNTGIYLDSTTETFTYNPKYSTPSGFPRFTNMSFKVKENRFLVRDYNFVSETTGEQGNKVYVGRVEKEGDATFIVVFNNGFQIMRDNRIVGDYKAYGSKLTENRFKIVRIGANVYACGDNNAKTEPASLEETPEAEMPAAAAEETSDDLKAGVYISEEGTDNKPTLYVSGKKDPVTGDDVPATQLDDGCGNEKNRCLNQFSAKNLIIHPAPFRPATVFEQPQLMVARLLEKTMDKQMKAVDDELGDPKIYNNYTKQTLSQTITARLMQFTVDRALEIASCS